MGIGSPQAASLGRLRGSLRRGQGFPPCGVVVLSPPPRSSMIAFGRSENLSTDKTLPTLVSPTKHTSTRVYVQARTHILYATENTHGWESLSTPTFLPMFVNDPVHPASTPSILAVLLGWPY